MRGFAHWYRLIAASGPMCLCALAEGQGSISSLPLAEPIAGTGARFERLSVEHTGVSFEQPLDYDHARSQLYLHGFAGSGVCIGDYDADGWPDIFMASHSGPDRLYRQIGDLRFEDVTEAAGVAGRGDWGAGATFADIDNDGDLDLYVACYDGPNLLHVNNGDGTFTESGAAAGLDFSGATIMPAFADMDNDGDLDVYLLTNRIYSPRGQMRMPRVTRRDGRLALEPGFEELHTLQERTIDGERQMFMVQAGQRDRLYRNNGDGTFSEVSEEAGMTGNHPGLSATWWDYNHDGLPDLYVANDYWDPDYLYRNNGDGTFTDVIGATVPHTTWFSMGADLGDIDNDGLTDFLVADMSSTTHFMQKITMGDMSDSIWFLESAEPRQYMRNALYLNTGTERFNEIAYLSGLASSDWTWSARLLDLDNDGRLDAYFTNGTVNQSLNPDFVARQTAVQVELTRSGVRDGRRIEDAMWDVYRAEPPRKEANLAFRNTGDLAFEPVGQEWGLGDVGLSYAAASADLDRDGDLDLVVGNLDEPAAIYRNGTVSGDGILVKLEGVNSNRFGLGAEITLRGPEGMQVRQLTLTRGFMSADEPLVHFGTSGPVDLEIAWPSGHRQVLSGLKTGRFYTVVEGGPVGPERPSERMEPMFRSVADVVGLDLKSAERPFDDYARQPLLPYKLSQLGPGLAFGDADGDGDDDLFVGGPAGQSGMLAINSNGRFNIVGGPWQEHAAREDMGILWFDADSDGDQDLLVASGGVECDPGAPVLGDRLYLNDGAGSFEVAEGLPRAMESSSKVCAADFDRDGDLDLFIAARVVPGRYPTVPRSRMLRNDAGEFTDVTDALAPGLAGAGLVTDALWSDVDADGLVDLLVACEWGPIRFWRNEGESFVERTEEARLAEHTGWWNAITGVDLDHDGDIDYLASNVGLNTKYHASTEKPALLYCGDLDGTGNMRLIEAEFEGDVLYPMRGRSCSSGAMPFIAQKFPTYDSFARASLADIYERLGQTEVLDATELRSVVLINDGAGRFDIRPLPRLAQASAAFGVGAADFDGDGTCDVLLAQNFFGPQPETGRIDGGMGLVLAGGDDGLRVREPAETGVRITGDAMAVAISDLDSDGRPDVVVSQNDADVVVLGNNGPAGGLVLRLEGPPGNPTGVGARVVVHHSDGSMRTSEVYAGSSYLSQSAAVVFAATQRGNPPTRVVVRWPDGRTTQHDLEGTASTLVTLSHPSS